MAEHGKFWAVAETKLLLDTWRQDHFQKQLRAAVRNNAVFRKISEVLEKRGYYQTIQQCHVKIKALKKRYRKIVDKLQKSGTGRESNEDDFPFFSDLYAVMGGRATVLPIHLLHSASSSTQSQGWQQDDNNDVDRPESPTSPISRLDTPGSLADRADPELSGPLNILDTGAPSTSRPNTPATWLQHHCNGGLWTFKQTWCLLPAEGHMNQRRRGNWPNYRRQRKQLTVWLQMCWLIRQRGGKRQLKWEDSV